MCKQVYVNVLLCIIGREWEFDIFQCLCIRYIVVSIYYIVEGVNYQYFNDGNLVVLNCFSKCFVYLDYFFCCFKFFQNVCVEVDLFCIEVVVIYCVMRFFSVFILCLVLYIEYGLFCVVIMVLQYMIDLIFCFCYQVNSRYVNWVIWVNIQFCDIFIGSRFNQQYVQQQGIFILKDIFYCKFLFKLKNIE